MRKSHRGEGPTQRWGDAASEVPGAAAQLIEFEPSLMDDELKDKADPAAAEGGNPSNISWAVARQWDQAGEIPAMHNEPKF